MCTVHGAVVNRGPQSDEEAFRGIRRLSSLSSLHTPIQQLSVPLNFQTSTRQRSGGEVG